jgi:membrane-bound serine protease (ClpP class)
VLGIAAILAGLILSLVGTGDTSDVILGAAGRVVFSLLIALIASLVILRFLPRLPFGRRLILETGLGAGHKHGSAPESDRRWMAKQGRASSPLRPAGIAEIEGERVDVVAEGEMIDAGEIIEVTRVDGNRIVVRRVPHITATGRNGK